MKRTRFIAALILSFAVLSSVSFASDSLCLYGLPQGSTGRIVDHQIYILCNNAKTKFADWVSYIVSPETVQGNTKTTRCWKADPLIPPDETLEPSDYKGAHKELPGTLYEHPMPSLPKADEPHQIPSGYWKIAAYERVPGDPSTLHCEAWIMDQNTARKTDFRTTRVSVDEVEIRAKIDVFWELEDSFEEALETSKGKSAFAFRRPRNGDDPN